MSREEVIRFLVDTAASADAADAWRADPPAALAAYELDDAERAQLLRPQEGWLSLLAFALGHEERRRSGTGEPPLPETASAKEEGATSGGTHPAPAHGPLSVRLDVVPVGDAFALSLAPDAEPPGPGAGFPFRLRLSPWRTEAAHGFTGSVERADPPDPDLGIAVEPMAGPFFLRDPWGHDREAAQRAAQAPDGADPLARARRVIAALRRGPP